jgi:quinol monooxygenase YgiN
MNTFYLHEQYKSKEGFHEHTQSPHFAEWKKFASTDPFIQPPIVSFFNVAFDGRK